MDVNDRRLRELYARWLDGTTQAGFAISLVAFLLYVGGVLRPMYRWRTCRGTGRYPCTDLSKMTGAPSGWAWLGELRYGDALNLAAVALLGLVTPVCYAG